MHLSPQIPLEQYWVFDKLVVAGVSFPVLQILACYRSNQDKEYKRFLKFLRFPYIRKWLYIKRYEKIITSSRLVQRLGYGPLTAETRVRFPDRETFFLYFIIYTPTSHAHQLQKYRIFSRLDIFRKYIHNLVISTIIITKRYPLMNRHLIFSLPCDLIFQTY